MTLTGFLNRYFLRALFVPLAIVGLLALTLVTTWRICEIHKNHRRIADFLHREISGYLWNAHEVLRVLARERVISGNTGTSEIRNISGFYRILLIRADQDEMMELTKAGVPLIYFPRPEERPAFSVPYYDPEFNAVTLGIIVQVGEWVAFGELNLASMNDSVKEWTASYPETSVIITDEYGNIISHRAIKPVRERENIADDPIFKKILPHSDLTTIVGLHEGRYVMVTGRRIGPRAWVVMVLNPLRSLAVPLVIVLGISFGIILIAGAIALNFKARLQDMIVGPVVAIVELAGKVERGEKIQDSSPVTRRSDLQEFIQLIGAIVSSYKKLEERERLTKQTSSELFWLVESIADAVIVVDKMGRILRMNTTAESLSGWNRFQALGEQLGRVFQLYDGEGEVDLCRLADQVIQRGVTLRLEGPIRLVSPEGYARYVLDSISPLKDGEGNVAGAVIVFHDVTAQVEAEEEAKRLERMLTQSQKMESLGTLVSGIAHEFNNILQILSGFLEMALEATEKADRRYEWLIKVRDASERAKELVKRLLTFSREQKPHLEPLDINRLILNTVDFLRTSIPRMIRVETLLADDLPKVKADFRQMELVLINLVVNARDAIGEDKAGTIKIGSALEVDDFGKSWVRVDVIDTGCGIPPEQIDRIFEPFFTTKEPGKGTGLGLSTVYGIVKSHGGRIEVESRVGEGSRFSVYLPVEGVDQVGEGEPAPSVCPEKADPARIGEREGRRPVVLVVDDEQLVLDFVAEILRRENFDVLCANSGEVALEHVDSAGDSITAVLLDINMPGMGGWKCLEEIRLRLPDVPIIVASGYVSAVMEKKAKEYRRVSVITKPYGIKELVYALKAALKL